MAKVFDVPRYKYQTKYKLIEFVDLATKLGLTNGSETIRYLGHDGGTMDPSYAALLSSLGIEFPLLNDEDLVADLGDELECLRQAYEHGFSLKDAEARHRVGCYGYVMNSLITVAMSKRKAVHTDDHATSNLLLGYLSGKYSPEQSDKTLKRWKSARERTTDLLTASTTACRMGSAVTGAAVSEVRLPGERNGLFLKFHLLAEAMEKLKLSSMSTRVAESHRQLTTTYRSTLNFRVSDTYAGRNLGCERIHRVGPFYVLEYTDAVYVLDSSALEQVVVSTRFWAGFSAYWTNYRIVGDPSSAKIDVKSLMTSTLNWISRTSTLISDKRLLPRLMKIGVARLQNNFHSHAEELDVGAQEKDAKLLAAEREVLPNGVTWYEHLTKMGISDRAKLDLAYCYHGLTAPDCELDLLFRKASETMLHPNKADKGFFREFLNYCKATDLAKALLRYKEELKFKTEEGYDPTEKTWYQQCLKGRLTLPPDDEMGKAWISDNFAYDFQIEDWFWDAGDVTHVTADLKRYTSVSSCTSQDRFESNELLYALKRAPMLSGDCSPEQAIRIAAGEKTRHDKVAVMAAKSENTKMGTKIRATWSADDITRELTAKYDRAGVPIAALYSGVTARKSERSTEGVFKRINDSIYSQLETLVISNDAVSWSDCGDREAWGEHHDYIFGTTTARKDVKLVNLWKDITAVIAKRGHVKTQQVNSGLFQGWTPTMDSIMNVHLSLFSVRLAKRQGLMKADETAETAGLIDDAVQAITLTKDADEGYAQRVADSHFRTTTDCWRKAGAQLDVVKTLYSSVKFVYLNRFFCHGTEVVCPCKVFAKADREITRRFASILEQFDCVVGSYRSAVGRGADPVVSYAYALFRCVDLAIQSNARLALPTSGSFQVVSAAFAPRGLGGWGLPTISAFLSNEAMDKLVEYLGVMYSLYDSLSDPRAKNTVMGLTEKVCEQEFDTDCHSLLFSNPTDVRAKSVGSHKSLVNSKLRRALKRYAESRAYKDALCEDLSGKAAKEQFLRSVRVDASVLEAIGECLPETVQAALIDRAYKSELLAQLISYRDRQELSSETRKANSKAVMHTIDLPSKPAVKTYEHARQNIVEDARDVRSRFYDGLAVDITNSTGVSYAICLARQSTGKTASLKVSAKRVTSICRDRRAESKYSNMYDGRVQGGAGYKIRSKSCMLFESEFYKALTPVGKCIAKAAALCMYLKSKEELDDRACGIVWEFICRMWGVSSDEAVPSLGVMYSPEASTKRIGRVFAHVNHQVLPFPNAQDAVHVDMAALQRYADTFHTHVDCISFANSAKLLYLMETAAQNADIGELCFAFVEGSLPHTDTRILEVTSESGVQKALDSCTSSPRLAESFRRTLVYTQLSHPGDGEVLCYKEAGGEHGLSGTGEAALYSTTAEYIQIAGTLSSAMKSGVAVAPAGQSSKYHRPTGADDQDPEKQERLRKRFERYKAQHGESAATIQCMLDIIGRYLPNLVSDRIVIAAWGSMVAACEESIPGFLEAYTRSVVAVKRVGGAIGEDHIKAICQGLHRACTGRLRNLNYKGDSHDKAIAAVLVNMAYGRYRTPDMYRVSSSTGPDAMKRHWYFASRRQRLLNTHGDESRRICSTLYGTMSRRVVTHRTKRDVITGIGAALQEAIATATGVVDVDPIAVEPSDMEYDTDHRKRIWEENLLIVCRRAGLEVNASMVIDVVSNIYEGLCCLVEAYAVRQSSVQQIKVSPMVPMCDIPGMSEGMVVQAGEEPGGVEQYKRVAASLFYNGRVQEALTVLARQDSGPHSEVHASSLGEDDVADAIAELEEITQATNVDEA